MPSNPTSPISPSQRRRSLRTPSFDTTIDNSRIPYPSAPTYGTTHSRRSSRASQTSFQLNSPATPRPMSSRSSRQTSFHHRRKSSSRLSIGSNKSIGSNISLEQGNVGIGNLADELEDALDDEYAQQETSFLDGVMEQDHDTVNAPTHSPRGIDNMHDLEFGMSGSDSQSQPGPSLQPVTAATATTTTTKSSKAEKRKSRHQRTESKYDGSDYGPESDQDDDGFTPMLSKRMADVEALTRMSLNTEDIVSEGGGVVKRTIHALKDLGPQASIENNLSRIITAYTSMATHRTHKTRDLFSQAHSLLYGNILDLSEQEIDLLLEELESLSSTMSFLAPQQQQNPLLSLQIVATQTLDLAQTLRTLTDALQESRISANIANRKLKSVRDMVDDLRFEEDLVEDSMMLIQAGDWDRRCRERHAAATCREVMEGFGRKWGLEIEDRPWMKPKKSEVVVG